MTQPKTVLIVGLVPELIDFSSPDFAAFPGLNAAKVRAALEADAAKLKSLGYEPDMCLTDFGATAEATLRDHLRRHRFDCILIGAGVRTVPSNLLLFEKLINVVHVSAPHAKICFNTKPDDTAAAIQRWI
ncbi:MAG: hypothetical protein K8T91_09200 [Planctomycetes bacterium]|nr:hypothetical protein [Planctomycetota bacterium]